jgi:hypothetical protein
MRTADPAAPPAFRLTSPEELVRALPHLLGFHPSRSLVLVGLAGARHRVVACVRADLPPEGVDLRPGPHEDPAEATARGARELGRYAAGRLVAALRADARTAGTPRRRHHALLVVVDAPGAGPPTGVAATRDEALVAGCQEGLGSTEVLDALLVRGDRWWSLLCADPVCCPPAGRPLGPGAPSPYEVAAVVEGSVPAADRQAVVDRLRPAPDDERAAFTAACAAGAAWWAGVPDRPAQRRELLAAAGTLGAPATAELAGSATAGRLVAALVDLPLRDAAALVADPDVALPGWLALARLATGEPSAPVLTVVGWLAYRRGDGVLARTAFEGALAAVPDYRLAVLLLAMLDGGLPPSLLEADGTTTLVPDLDRAW